MNEIVFAEESYAIMGACFEVYKEMGPGFLEPVYQECVGIELSLRGIPFQDQPELLLSYKGKRLKKKYKPDYVCFGKIILELKAVTTLSPMERAQVHNYLKATEFKLGLLVNLAHRPQVEYERIVR